ncbi:DUF3888 domain-containing protein [Domibacillus mangrovi]|uniref:DUF3888 domain-containing protein n=1 Tax=Domibacillus mangrovi TaxID=1714354 RepID=A0A1Q5P461_9BACI|nr:DUF3888 domain-containing protein [Domibacillus mangrovi]OKL36973.1 hypothetical protein BLL40_05110 [Domibacillus mangrovi]
MKKIIISLFLLTSLIIFSEYAQAGTEYTPQNQYPNIMERAFLRELGPSILEAMFANGDKQLFNSERIEKIVSDEQDDHYEVTLRVIGYEGSFNPPYKLIRITFQIPGVNYSGKNSVFSYSHRFINLHELRELTKYSN